VALVRPLLPIPSLLSPGIDSTVLPRPASRLAAKDRTLDRQRTSSSSLPARRFPMPSSATRRRSSASSPSSRASLASRSGSLAASLRLPTLASSAGSSCSASSLLPHPLSPHPSSFLVLLLSFSRFRPPLPLLGIDRSASLQDKLRSLRPPSRRRRQQDHLPRRQCLERQAQCPPLRR
jgi:hypothetical protein